MMAVATRVITRLMTRFTALSTNQDHAQSDEEWDENIRGE